VGRQVGWRRSPGAVGSGPRVGWSVRAIERVRRVARSIERVGTGGVWRSGGVARSGGVRRSGGVAGSGAVVGPRAALASRAAGGSRAAPASGAAVVRRPSSRSPRRWRRLRSLAPPRPGRRSPRVGSLARDQRRPRGDGFARDFLPTRGCFAGVWRNEPAEWAAIATRRNSGLVWDVCRGPTFPAVVRPPYSRFTNATSSTPSPGDQSRDGSRANPSRS